MTQIILSSSYSIWNIDKNHNEAFKPYQIQTYVHVFYKITVNYCMIHNYGSRSRKIVDAITTK